MRFLLLIVSLATWTTPAAAQILPSSVASSPLFAGMPTPRWRTALEAQPDTFQPCTGSTVIGSVLAAAIMAIPGALVGGQFSKGHRAEPAS